MSRLNEENTQALLDAFVMTAREFSLVETLDKALEMTGTFLRTYLGEPEGWSICMLQPNSSAMKIMRVYNNGRPRTRLWNTNLPEGDSLTMQTIRTGKNVVIANVSGEESFHTTIDAIGVAEVRSFVGIPFSTGGSLLGVLTIVNPTQLPLPGTLEEKYLNIMADCMAISIARVLHIEALREAAIIDPLTQLFNRRGFLQIIQQEMERCRRFQRTLSLLMIDIDNFKQINDAYGHLKGDDTLQHFSQVLVECVRKVDYICRYGGDEFIVLMPDTTLNNANEVRARIIESVDGGSHNLEIPYEVSIGAYAGCPGSSDELLEQADRDLYRIKQEKRRQMQDTSGGTYTKGG